MSTIYNIGRITYQETVRYPLFYIVIAVSAVLILISPLFCLFSFGEEVSMMKEVGLATITFAGILISVLASSFVITGEIENLTAVMLLAKPVRRSQFIIGKFAGISFVILITFVFLTAVFIFTYWLKEGLPAITENFRQGLYIKNKSIMDDIYGFFRKDAWLLVKGVYGCFLQVLILTGFAVFFSTYFSLVFSGIGCFAILILGNISDYFYSALSKQSFVIIKGLGYVISAILPHFTVLNTSSLVATKTVISINYLFWTSFYTLIYVSLVLYLAIMIFSRSEIKWRKI